MGTRVLHAFGSGVCEALPVQLVNDIFFLHERGKRIGYYTGIQFLHQRENSADNNQVCLCLGATGPLYAGYMLAGGYSWRLYFYVEIAFAGALLILAFFVVEETMYDRKSIASTIAPTTENGSTSDSKEVNTQHTESENHVTTIPDRKSFISTLKPWSHIDHEAEFFMTMIRPFSYFVVPAVFWVITTYGSSLFPSFAAHHFLTSI
jgi:hypothetical protein